MTLDLVAAGRAIGAPIEVEAKAPGGSSSTTLLVRVGGRAAVLQHPPAGPLLPTAHDLARQARFLSALRGTGVAVPEVLAFVADPAVAGLPFLVTARVEGVCLLVDPRPASTDVRRLAPHALDTLAAIHAVDWAGRGLTAPGGRYLARQIDRWHDQLARTPTAMRLGPLEPAAEWLRAHLPAREDRTIVHGDYGFHNLLVAGSSVTAVLDWELATVGDPIADLIGFLKSWQPDPLSPNPANDAVACAPGAPGRDELIARYERATGRDVAVARAFYDAFVLYKAIGVYEGVHARSGGTRFVDEPIDMVQRLRQMIGVK